MTAADVAAARELRETLRPVVLAVLDGRRPDVAPLRPWLSADEPVRAVVRDGRPAAAPPSTLAAALARLARQAVEQLPDAPLRACADDECRLAYLDPGGRRRWCATERAGEGAGARPPRTRPGVRGPPRVAEGAPAQPGAAPGRVSPPTPA